MKCILVELKKEPASIVVRNVTWNIGGEKIKNVSIALKRSLESNKDIVAIDAAKIIGINILINNTNTQEIGKEKWH